MKPNFLQVKSFLFLSFLLCAGSTHAQVVTGCNLPSGGLQILFDYNQNCPNSPGSLAGLAEIGFHSGVNTWTNVVEWDKPNATKGYNIGNDSFLVTIPNVTTYYGVSVTVVNFVFNQGPADPASPWASEGKEDNGTGGCNDFFLVLANITNTCPAVSVKNLQLEKHLTIAPNPFSDFAVIEFENAAQDKYEIVIRNSFGQLIEVQHEFTGNSFVFNKNNHAPGFYSITLTNEEGRFISSRMVIQ